MGEERSSWAHRGALPLLRSAADWRGLVPVPCGGAQGHLAFLGARTRLPVPNHTADRGPRGACQGHHQCHVGQQLASPCLALHPLGPRLGVGSELRSRGSSSSQDRGVGLLGRPLKCPLLHPALPWRLVCREQVAHQRQTCRMGLCTPTPAQCPPSMVPKGNYPPPPALCHYTTGGW